MKRDMHHITQTRRHPGRRFTAAILVLSASSLGLGVQTTHAAFPGTNGKIAYVSSITGSQDIFAVNPDGSGAVNLSNFPGAYDVDPAWSPDGSKLAFTSGRTGNGDIYVMNADGSNQTRLTNDNSWDLEPSWSPDGTRIVFSSYRSGRIGIWVMNADGSNPALLNDQGSYCGGPGSPAWSPDGSKIAFFSSYGCALHVWMMNPDGTGRINLGEGSSPAWSPDSSRIVVAYRFDGQGTEIVTMNPDGTEIRRLTVRPGNDSDPAWSPDGSKIIFIQDFSFQGGGRHIRVMNADGSGQAQLVNDPGLNTYGVDWQPQTAPPDAPNVPPLLQLPGNITADATSPAGTAVTFTATATDDADRAPAVVCGPASGSTFPIGLTRVTCTATDSKGASSTGSFTVTVLGAEDSIAALRADVAALVAADPGSARADKLEDVLAKLDQVLTELGKKTPADRQAALGNLEGAVGDLEAAVSAGLLSGEQGGALLERAARAARLLAATAIEQAVSRGADSSTIGQARASVSDGDQRVAAGAYKDGVAAYKNAVSLAEGA